MAAYYYEPLAHLFAQMRVPDAVFCLSQWGPQRRHLEISTAFARVPWAPSAFLQCLSYYIQLPDSDAALVAEWAQAAVASINAMAFAQILPPDNWLAGSLLAAFQRSPMRLAADFALAFRVEPHALTAFSQQLLDGGQVRKAVQFMSCLNMKPLLAVDVVLDAVIRQMFVGDNQSHRRQFVQMLISYKAHNKVIKKRLSLFGMKASDFPVYFEQQQKATLRFLIYSKEYEQGLRFVADSQGLKFHACRTIIQHAGAADPATKQFVYRSRLTQNFPEIDTSGEEDKAFENKDDLEQLDSCLSLVDTIGENNIVFVDTPEALQSCAQYLMKQRIIGFDAEWKAIHVCAEPSNPAAPCALIQLASRDKAFVVDVVELSGHGHILAPLFQSEEVLKLGFDPTGDIKVLRPLLTEGGATKFSIAALVDLQAVARDLCDRGSSVNSNNQYAGCRDDNNRSTTGNESLRAGLSAVAEKYLGLPLDKRVRMSDWERRPLTRAQLHYAALDAHVLLQIYDKMQEQHPADAVRAAVDRFTQNITM